MVEETVRSTAVGTFRISQCATSRADERASDDGSDTAVRPVAHFGKSRHLTPGANFVKLRRLTSDVRIRAIVADVGSVSFDKACRTYLVLGSNKKSKRAHHTVL